MGWIMLVANDGGHITQLSTLAARFDTTDDRLWVTVPTPQTESMLAGERVHWTEPAPTRDWRAALRNARSIRRLFATYDVTMAVSTGSSLAVSALPQVVLHRKPAHYIESVTRTDGISLSGRMLSRIPGMHLYVQWPHLATSRWAYRGSVLDTFTTEAAPERCVRRMVVSLGTSSSFGFRRVVERLVQIVPTDVEVLWQTGSTDTSGLGIDGRVGVPAAELAEAIGAADVVVAHAGAGIAITALSGGKVPLLVPRLASRGEHVDDHQEQIAGQLAQRQLAIVADVESVDWDIVRSATRWRAIRVADAPSFVLNGVGDRT